VYPGSLFGLASPCRWIESCIEEELPPTTELEQALRNGVILGKLGHYYAPDVLPLRRIYDLNEAKYQVSGLMFYCIPSLPFSLSLSSSPSSSL